MGSLFTFHNCKYSLCQFCSSHLPALFLILNLTSIFSPQLKTLGCNVTLLELLITSHLASHLILSILISFLPVFTLYYNGYNSLVSFSSRNKVMSYLVLNVCTRTFYHGKRREPISIAPYPTQTEN